MGNSYELIITSKSILKFLFHNNFIYQRNSRKYFHSTSIFDSQIKLTDSTGEQFNYMPVAVLIMSQ